ncbi:MAG: hypothetical protein GXP27_04330 [Planctomycetes bacterium]|nr:hypothetical protein [Planctomycetota bacterium]
MEVIDTPLGTVPPGHTYHQLAVVGFKASFVETVHGCENVCPHCGKAPIVCEESCEWNWYCPACHKETMFIKGLSRPWPKDEPDPRIRVLGNPKLDAQRCARVEGRRWKGEDMIFRASCAEQGHLVSGRVRRIIERFEGNVEFEDVAFDVSGMSPEMLRRLEQIK